jgi:hypothetical protein
MKELLFGGLLYLFGVALILVFRPRLMFTEEGAWKEFGIGRDATTHTWMPFWLFCILWAILSYGIISFLTAATAPAADVSLLERPVRRNGLRAALNVPPAGYGNLKAGKYVLNQNTTRRKGVPHYVYFGDAPLIEEQL